MQERARPSATADAETTTPALVCRLGHQLFGISSELIESMVLLPEVVPVPDTPGYVRGVLNLRGQILKVVDLRKRLGMELLAEESASFVNMLDERLRDHKNWIQKLREAAEEGVLFRGQVDPTMCAFGRWYGSFETEDVVVRAMLKRFDDPHRRIHAVAHDVNRFVEQGDVAAAKSRVHEAEELELKELEYLFAATKEAYLRSRREIAVVIERAGQQTAVVVDQVVAVEELMGVHSGSSTLDGSTDMVASIGRRARADEEVVCLLNDDLLFQC